MGVIPIIVVMYGEDGPCLGMGGKVVVWVILYEIAIK